MNPILRLLIAGTILLYGCNDDSSIKSENEKNLLGTWVITKYELSECDDADANGDHDYDCTETTCARTTFFEDGRYESINLVNSVKTISTGSYEAGKSSITFCSDLDFPCVSLQAEVTSVSLIVHQPRSENSNCLSIHYYSRYDN